MLVMAKRATDSAIVRCWPIGAGDERATPAHYDVGAASNGVGIDA